MPKIFLLLIVGCSATVGAAAEWGDLKVRFVHDGQAPKPRRFEISKDAEICGKKELIDESLLVNDVDGGIANVVVFLADADGQAVPVHPSYAMKAAEDFKLLIEDCRFQPHVGFLRTSQTLVIENKDLVGHNPSVDARENATFGDVIPTGLTVKRRLTSPERDPVPVHCSIHPWLSAWLIVRDNPYGAVSDSHGKILIRQLPVGRWRFRIWQERLGWVKEVTRGDEAEAWETGHVEIAIAEGENDLGEIKLLPPRLER